MRLLGIDFGFKRIGVAVAETDAEIASPRPAMTASGALKRDAVAIAEVAKREQVDRIIVGLPIEESGEEGRMARICRTLASHLTDLGFTVDVVDETLTSVTAEATMLSSGLKASDRRKRRDGEAAALILERYMHEEASR